MYPEKTQHLLQKLIVQVLGTLICQTAIAAKVTEQFPDSRPVRAAVQSELSTSALSLSDDECIEDSPAPALATSPRDSMRLTASTSIPERRTSLPPTKIFSQKAEGPHTETETSSRLYSGSSLALKKEGPLDWQTADATSVQTSSSSPSTHSASSLWEITPSDVSLNAAIGRWAVMAGWQLVWELPVDYTVESRATIPGTFEEAVEAVARSMGSAETPMKAIFYRKNKVVRIVAKGAQ